MALDPLTAGLQLVNTLANLQLARFQAMSPEMQRKQADDFQARIDRFEDFFNKVREKLMSLGDNEPEKKV